LKKRPQH